MSDTALLLIAPTLFRSPCRSEPRSAAQVLRSADWRGDGRSIVCFRGSIDGLARFESVGHARLHHGHRHGVRVVCRHGPTARLLAKATVVIHWRGALTPPSAFAKMTILVMPKPSSWRGTRDMISPGLEAVSPSAVDADPTGPSHTGDDR